MRRAPGASADFDVTWLFLRAIYSTAIPPLPTADTATAPVPLPPTATTAVVVAGSATFPPLHRRPPLYQHMLVHTGGAYAAHVPPLAPLGAAGYSRTHRRAPPSALAQPLAHAHVPAACRRTGTGSLLAAHAQEHAPLSGSSALQHILLVRGFCPFLVAVLRFLFAARFATPARTHVRARTTDDGRSDVRSASAADCITAAGGARSVRSQLRRPPLLATSIATLL